MKYCQLYLLLILFLFIQNINAQSDDVEKVFAIEGAITASTNDGSLYAWGNSGYGGSLNGVNFQGLLIDITSTSAAFAALNSEGKVFVWGNEDSGGIVNKNLPGENIELETILDSNIIKIYSNKYSFLAVTNSNSLITWGGSEYGGYINDSQIYHTDKIIQKVVSNDYAHAVLFTDGSIIRWGNDQSFALVF